MTKSYENRTKELKQYGVNKLVEDYICLEDTKKAYEVSLRAEIERIQALGDWKRFWGSVKLFANLFKVIQEGFEE